MVNSMTMKINSGIEQFGVLAHELVERLQVADSFKWFKEIGPQTINLELARQSWLPSRQGDDEPAFLILEVSSRDRRPDLATPMLKNLSKLVQGQLGGGVTRLVVMFYRQPDESKCTEKLLSVTNQGKHSYFQPETNHQTAIHTLQHWIDAVAETDRD
jgi:hypothetical protein